MTSEAVQTVLLWAASANAIVCAVLVWLYVRLHKRDDTGLTKDEVIEYLENLT